MKRKKQNDGIWVPNPAQWDFKRLGKAGAREKLEAARHSLAAVEGALAVLRGQIKEAEKKIFAESRVASMNRMIELKMGYEQVAGQARDYEKKRGKIMAAITVIERELGMVTV